jgi:carbonic anhydrase
MTDIRPTPAEAWEELQRGNERFVAGAVAHPREDAARRAELVDGQAPVAVILGCSDSRIPPELAFDHGLGDLFVVRTAGQTASMPALGSIEYAVAKLGTPLLVVLSHETCGAVGAAIASAQPDAEPLPPHIAEMIAPIGAAVAATPGGDQGAVGRRHLHDTVGALLEQSELLSDAVAAGRLGVVGADYRLLEGRVVPDVLLGL